MDELLKTYTRCDKLKPICDLSRNDREYLFESAVVKSITPHTLITPEPNRIIYLLEGEISLLSGGFVIENFTHADRRGLSSIFDVQKEEDAALFVSHGAILEIDRELSEGLCSQLKSDNEEIGANQLQREEQRLFERLREALQADQLQLPALPEAALKIRQVINKPEVTSDEIVQIVQTDPTLSARLIKVANSPLYGTWREIKSVRDAVRRLGLETTRSLSFSLSVRQLFHAKSTLIKQQIQQMYEESIQVSALAYVITRNRAVQLDPEQALLAGLLHKLGIIPILKYIDENPGLISSTESLNKSLINLNVPISRLMFKHWHFDDEFLKVVESCSNWYRDSGMPADYVDIVIAARLLYLQNKNQLDESIILEQVPVVNKLDLLEVDERGFDFYSQAKAEIDDMQKILQV